MSNDAKQGSPDPLADRNIVRRWKHDNPMSIFEYVSIERRGANYIAVGWVSDECCDCSDNLAYHHLLAESDAQRAEIERLRGLLAEAETKSDRRAVRAFVQGANWQPGFDETAGGEATRLLAAGELGKGE